MCCVRACTHICMCRPENDVDHSLLHSPFFFLTQGFSLSQRFTGWPDWLASELGESGCLSLSLCPGYRGTGPQCLRECWQSDLRTSSMCEMFSDGGIFLASPWLFLVALFPITF